VYHRRRCLPPHQHNDHEGESMSLTSFSWSQSKMSPFSLHCIFRSEPIVSVIESLCSLWDARVWHDGVYSSQQGMLFFTPWKPSFRHVGRDDLE
jgi:hypothetical protein